MNRGFTLLEVLIALAILSTVALLAVRVSGDSLTQLAETGWEDGVLRAGRGKMIHHAHTHTHTHTAPGSPSSQRTLPTVMPKPTSTVHN